MTAFALSTAELCKRTSLLRRRPDWTPEAFRAHWAGPHADIACSIPGIARYTQNRTIDCLWRTSPTAYECDGLVELEFQSETALLAANTHVAVKQLLPEDELRFLQAITLCRVPQGAQQVWPGFAKVMLAARWQAPSAALSSWSHWLHELDCITWSVEEVSSTLHRPQLQHESEPPQLFANLWCESERAARRAFEQPSGWRAHAPQYLAQASAWLVDPLAIIE